MNIAITTPVYISNDLLWEFTDTTLKSIKTIHPFETIVVENYALPQYEKQLANMVNSLIINPKGNTVSGAWNIGVKEAFERYKADYCMIINNDIIFQPNAIDNLVKFAEEHKEYVLWTAGEWKGEDREQTQRALKNNLAEVKSGEGFDDHPHFSCFMISPKTIELLKSKEEGTKEPNPGYFDESMKMAYFEDNDYHTRILRAGGKAGKTATSLFYHYGSRTIKTDEEVDLMNKQSYRDNREYFIKKWGWDPHAKVTDNDDPVRFKYKQPFMP